MPAIPGPVGEKGPFLELIPNRHTNVPGTILTKTHCKGICTRDDCGPGAGIETVRSFMHGCVSGLKAVEENGKIVTHKVAYDPKLVKKAIHIFRHPYVSLYYISDHCFATVLGDELIIYLRSPDLIISWLGSIWITMIRRRQGIKSLPKVFLVMPPAFIAGVLGKTRRDFGSRHVIQIIACEN